MKIELTDYTCVSPGEYAAQLMEIEKRTGDFGDFLLFKYELTEPDVIGTKISAPCSGKFSRNSKMFGWVSALLGKTEFEPGFVLDTADLIGKPCGLTIETKPSKDGSEFSRIVSMRAYNPERRTLNSF